MRTAAIFLALAFPAFGQLPPTALTPVRSPAEISVAPARPVAPLVKLEPTADPEARHFRISVFSSTTKGSLAYGGYFDVAPGGPLPRARFGPSALDLRPGERRKPEVSRLQQSWRDLGEVYVRGLVTVADGDSWKGMLERDGVFRYETEMGTRTVRAYKLSEAKDPIPALEASEKTVGSKLKGTTLDQR